MTDAIFRIFVNMHGGDAKYRISTLKNVISNERKRGEILFNRQTANFA
jgi:hypothetical protein